MIDYINHLCFKCSRQSTWLQPASMSGERLVAAETGDYGGIN